MTGFLIMGNGQPAVAIGREIVQRDDLAFGSTPEWDSLSDVNPMVALETEYGVSNRRGYNGRAHQCPGDPRLRREAAMTGPAAPIRDLRIVGKLSLNANGKVIVSRCSTC